jgi:hypothetical protein
MSSVRQTISVDGPSFAETISDVSFSLNETITDSVPFSVDDMDLLSYVSFDREQGGDKIYMDDENYRADIQPEFNLVFYNCRICTSRIVLFFYSKPGDMVS